MDPVHSLLLVYGMTCLGLLSPGPNIIAVVATALEHGRWPGVTMAIGVGVGSAIWASLAVAGLTGLIIAHAALFTAVKIFGVAYLLWLAVQAFRRAASREMLIANGKAGSSNPARAFWSGLTVQMSNPKAALHWVAVGVIAINPGSPSWVAIALIVGTGILSVLGYGAYAVAFSTSVLSSGYRRIRRAIDAALGTFFLLAAWKVMGVER